MKRWIMTIALGLAAGAAAAAGEQAVATRDMGADRVIAGDAFSQQQPVPGDLLAAGGTVEVLGEVGGDALLAGGRIRVAAPVRQSVYAAGGRVTIESAVQRNLRMAGGKLEIAPAARVRGNVSAAGGELRVLGPVDGYLSIGGGSVLIDAAVAGDVDVRAGRVELGPAAVIGGRLRYASGDEIVRDPGAQLRGGIERATPASWEAPRQGASGIGWLWTAGLVVLAAVLAAAWPAGWARVQRNLIERPAASGFAGLGAFIGVPVLAVLFFITLVGIPLGLMTLLAYPVLLLVGYAALAIGAGRVALARWSPPREAHRGWQALAAALCMLALGLAARVPWLGGLVVLVALWLGMGTLLLAAWRAAAAAPRAA